MSLIKTQFTEVEKHKRMKPLKGDNWSGGMRLMLGGVESVEEVLAQTQFSGDCFSVTCAFRYSRNRANSS